MSLDIAMTLGTDAGESTSEWTPLQINKLYNTSLDHMKCADTYVPSSSGYDTVCYDPKQNIDWLFLMQCGPNFHGNA